MNRKRRTLAGLAVVAVIALAAVALGLFNREPSYEGKTLSAWLRIYEEHGDDRERQQAREAVRHIGRGGLTLLTQRLRHEHSEWRDKANRYAWRFIRSPAGHPFRWLWQDSAGIRADQAAEALAILGEEASPAIPALTNLLADWKRVDTCGRALSALAYTGTNGLTEVLNVLTNTASPTAFRFYAIECIGSLGTNANLAIPTLIRCLNDRDIGPQSARCLGKLQLQPEVVVPALIKALRSENPLTAKVAADALAEFGPQALAAVPELTLATTNAGSDVRSAATNALRAIAPQVLGNAAHENGP